MTCLLPRRFRMWACAFVLVSAGQVGPAHWSATGVAASPVVPVAADLPIPGGDFFTEALPDGDGMGFAVYDGHGASVWTAFSVLGGVAELGYPISRRFDWDGAVAQAFQWGVLRWDAAAGAADLRPESDLPDGQLPAEAIEPEWPPFAAAQAEQVPWSGWWWPSSQGPGPTLFATNGVLEKYDRYVAQATGEDPRTRVWERQRFFFPGTGWAGHCNGWAAAALLEPEPTEALSQLGVTFSVGDLKGLLSAYHFADAAAWSRGENGAVNPVDFHRTLLSWLGKEGKGFVVTFDMGRGEVWSYPAYQFESSWRPDPDADGVWWVTTTLWMADMDVPVNFVGLKPYPGPAGKTFQYVLEGDPRDPSGGYWVGPSVAGRFAHPGRIWYPEPAVRNLDGQWASPNLDRGTIDNIILGRIAPFPEPEVDDDQDEEWGTAH